MSARFGLIRRPHGLLTCSTNIQRPIFFSRAVVPRGRRWFSAVDGRKRGRFLTLAFTPEGYDKETIIEITRRSLEDYQGQLGDSRTAVVLASKGVADWLSDPAFLANLLAPWRSSVLSEMDILAAVVDSIRPPQDPNDPPPSEGIAIITGEEVNELLPGLWEDGLAPATQDHHHGHGHVKRQESKGSIEFRLPRLVGGGANLHVTVPLANTVFTNGRPHTMFAARLSEVKEEQPADFTRLVEKTSQVINPGRGPRFVSQVSAPLLAITKPRKVLQGLGNILRQVEIDGEPAPASQELEHVIPKFVMARERSDLGAEMEQRRPLTVWAAIYPDQLVSGERKPLSDEGLLTLSLVNGGKFQYPEALQVEDFGSPASEAVSSQEFRILMPGIVVGGGQVRQVLSGGGGWGNKKGLLSLDQESRYSTEDQDSIDDFIRSFKGQDSAENGGSGVGIIPAGSWVQFFVEAAPRYVQIGAKQPVPKPYQEIRQLESYGDTISLGVKDEIGEPRLEYNTMRVAQNYFGVATAGGLYLESVPVKTGPFRKDNQPAITTKIAVPRAEVLSFI